MGKVVTREHLLRYQLVGLIPHLRRFARSLTKDSDKADDLVQEACERALKKLNRSGEELHLKNLLYRIIYNRWIDNLRRRKIRSAKLIVLSEQNQERASDHHAGSRLDLVLDLQTALDKLDGDAVGIAQNFTIAGLDIMVLAFSLLSYYPVKNFLFAHPGSGEYGILSDYDHDHDH